MALKSMKFASMIKVNSKDIYLIDFTMLNLFTITKSSILPSIMKTFFRGQQGF